MLFRVRENPECKRRADCGKNYFRADFIEAATKTAHGLPKTISRNDFLRAFRPNFLSFFEVILMIINRLILRACASSAARQSASLFCAFFLIVCLMGTATAQASLTRAQFSRLNVLSRAAFFEREILNAANAEAVDPHLLWTIAYLETRFRPWLTSPKDARGMMQFIPSTAARFDLKNPYEPVPAIRAAARYVKVLSNLFGGRVDSILAAYNSGEGTVAAYSSGRSMNNGRKIINPNNQKTIGGVPPYAETVGYVGRGLKIYRWLVFRQTFNAGIVRANFPAYISRSVARVSLYDPGLGNVADFRNASPNNIALITRTNQIQPKDAAQTAGENTNEGADSNAKNPFLTEVYYDSRSGNRYQVKGDVKIKLTEAGAVVINTESRPETTPKARSTFFAAPTNK